MTQPVYQLLSIVHDATRREACGVVVKHSPNRGIGIKCANGREFWIQRKNVRRGPTQAPRKPRVYVPKARPVYSPEVEAFAVRSGLAAEEVAKWWAVGA